MPRSSRDRFLFIHIMKTGGTSFADIIAANFAADERYPDVSIAPDAGLFRRFEAYLFVPGLVADANAHAGQLRMVRGHVPYAVRNLLHDQFTALTLLRNPVDRTVSYLKHCHRYHNEHQSLSLEAIYEDPWFQASFIGNYQTKLFSMTANEALAEDRFLAGAPRVPPRHLLSNEEHLSAEVKALRQSNPGRFSLECFAASTGVIEVDEARLAVAKDNLAAVELVGVTEHYDRFLQCLVERYGWQIKSIPHRHAGDDSVISPVFRRRIAADNQYDMELYELARTLSP